jgi:hypothetical protein
MKKFLFLLVAVAFTATFAAKADAPEKINLSYQDGKLKIEAIHKVKDVTKHYIEKITIAVNGKEAKTLKLNKQSSNAEELQAIDLPGLKNGDKVEVVARCSEFGKKSAKLVIK